MLRLDFLGAAQTVTGSMHMLSINGRRLLLDCGLYQGRRQETYRRNLNFPFDPASIDALILSHAHIDHSGNIPNLVKQGFQGNVWATSATRDLCSAMLRDSAHIMERDTAYVSKKQTRKGEPPVEPLYTLEDATACLRNFIGIDYARTMMIVPGVWLTFYDAGHILGSAIVVLDIEDGTQKVRLAFSGDLGRLDLPILRDPVQIPPVDYLIIESTYGNREHESPAEAAYQLRQVAQQAFRRGGKVIIPAFAVGRTQEIVYDLHRLSLEQKIPRLPVFVDSPLAIDVTEIFRLHPEYYDEEANELLLQGRDPFGFSMLRYTRATEESKALNFMREPAIIISASGMCEAGRILHHLKHNVGEPENVVLFVGFQAENTLGRRLVDGEKTVHIFGEPYRVRAQIETINGYSAHADRSELLAYVRSLAPHLRAAYVVHGELPAAESLARGLSDLGVPEVLVPDLGQKVILN